MMDNPFMRYSGTPKQESQPTGQPDNATGLIPGTPCLFTMQAMPWFDMEGKIVRWDVLWASKKPTKEQKERMYSGKSSSKTDTAPNTENFETQEDDPEDM